MIRLIISVIFKAAALIAVIAALIAATALLIASYAPNLQVTTSQFALFAVSLAGVLLTVCFLYRLEALKRSCDADVEQLENRINDIHNIVLGKKLRMAGDKRSEKSEAAHLQAQH